MRIEIVEYYPLADKAVPYDTGTLHVYLCDFDVDIRGIGVMFSKGRWYINMPFFTGFDSEKQQAIRYSIFSLTNREKHKELIDLIRTEAVKYITENFINKLDVKLSSFKPYAPKEVKIAKQKRQDQLKKVFKTKDGNKKWSTKS